MKQLIGFLSLALFYATPAEAGVAFYNTLTDFNAHATGTTTDTFTGLVSTPPGFNYYASGAYTSSSGTNYAINRATSNGNLYIVDPSYYPTPAPYPYISSQQSTGVDNNLTITFPHAVTAVAFDYASFGAATLTFTLSTGDSFTETSPGGSYPGTFSFIGLTSTAPITSIQITDPVTTANPGFNLSNVAFGNAASVPEPSPRALAGATFLVALCAWKRRSKNVTRRQS